MKIWVDCTAAAHPLVLRPIIERLESAGHRVEVTSKVGRGSRFRVLASAAAVPGMRSPANARICARRPARRKSKRMIPWRSSRIATSF